jgi:hypothetical protein
MRSGKTLGVQAGTMAKRIAALDPQVKEIEEHWVRKLDERGHLPMSFSEKESRGIVTVTDVMAAAVG